MEKKFILAVSDHRIVGFVLLPYIVEKQDKTDYYTLVERITNEDVRKRPAEFSDHHKKIVKIIEEYSDTELVRVFSKKKINSQEFLAGLNADMLTNHIRPFIERRLIKIIEALKTSDIDLYYKDSPKQIYLSDKITVARQSADAVFNFILNAEEFKYYLSVSYQQHEMKLTNQPGIILVNEPCYLLLNNQLLSFNDIDGKKLTPFFKHEFVKVPKAREEEYLEKFVANTIKKFKVNGSGFSIVEEIPTPKVILSLEGDLAYLPVIKTTFDYGKNRVFLANEPIEISVTLAKENGNYTFYKTLRNKNTEDETLQFLSSLGLSNNATAYFRLPQLTTDTPADLLYDMVCWLNNHNNELENKGYIIKQDFFDKQYYHQTINLQTSFNGKDDWFDVYALVILEGFELPFIRFRRNILEGKREFTLPDGRIVILPKEWFAKFADMFYFGKADGDHLLLKQYHINILNNTPFANHANYKEALIKLVESANSGQKNTLPQVNATLRPYQEEGFAWMYWLYNNNLGACLADDMGLGKTLQTLVLLKKVIAAYETKNAVNAPATLIILPASLVHNWYNEIQKFTPEINALKYIGAGRSIEITDFDKYPIILTTYGVVRNEYEELSHYKFLYIILDESQTIKNPDSKIFQAVTELKSLHRLVLTGTPIENSLTDLWSQMEFINPGILNDLNFFKQYFVYPIEKDGDEEKRDRLKRLIQPFILRRTKQAVATDLPALTEQIVFCSMSDSQKAYYEEEKSKVRNEILQTVDQEGIEKSTITILNALMKLRQIANHPLMLDNDYAFDSGKFEEVTISLENMYLENHKVLIFSSFVKHLELFRKYFEEKNLTYSLLTGETRNREEVVRNFQENDDNRFFLISLKAGGVGLNLTAADYVFILDPWWNPAAEMQAINRAHRIGQTNKVFVYRFISAETVEEKIIKLQERKSELAEIFINSNNPFKSLSRENILELFE
jgi:superfamily II DNA or RNA helicase